MNPGGAGQHWPRRPGRQRPELGLGVVWEGTQFLTHSLAIVNRQLCLELLDRGVDLGIKLYEEHEFQAGDDPDLLRLEACFDRVPSAGTRVHVRHQWPPSFCRPREGAWVMIQPWEFGVVPREWIEPMEHQVDELWVPSRYARQCYIDSGLSPHKVQVIPNGVDVKRFCPEVPPAPLKTRRRFKFLFVGGTIPRKGIRLLLETYRRFFTGDDDVCLVIKDMGRKGVYRGSTCHEEIQRLQSDPHAPEVEYIDRHLRHDEVAGLYTAAHVLVHPYHGEGFGMPISEAMSCGIPAIVTGLGAAMDFCNQGNAYLIPASRHDMDTDEVGGMPAAGRPWLANPDADALGHLMRQAVLDPGLRRTRGRAARRTIVEEFTWSHAGDLVLERLNALHRMQRPVAPVSGTSSDTPPSNEAALRLDLVRRPGAAAPYLRLAEFLQSEERWDEAAETLSRGLERLPASSAIQERMAWLAQCLSSAT